MEDVPNSPSVSLKHILLSEILSVTSVMRKNSRWAMSTHSFGSSGDSTLATSLGLRRTRQYPVPYMSERGSTEQELMRGFQELRRLVKDVQGLFLKTAWISKSVRRMRTFYRHPVVTSDHSDWSLLRHNTISVVHRPDYFSCALIITQLLPVRPYPVWCNISGGLSQRTQQHGVKMQV